MGDANGGEFCACQNPPVLGVGGGFRNPHPVHIRCIRMPPSSPEGGMRCRRSAPPPLAMTCVRLPDHRACLRPVSGIRRGPRFGAGAFGAFAGPGPGAWWGNGGWDADDPPPQLAMFILFPSSYDDPWRNSSILQLSPMN